MKFLARACEELPPSNRMLVVVVNNKVNRSKSVARAFAWKMVNNRCILDFDNSYVCILDSDNIYL
jgi:hypothetical protein